MKRSVLVSHPRDSRNREDGARNLFVWRKNHLVPNPGRILLQGLRAAVLGCIAGVALALGFTRFMASMLYGVSAVDPATYSAVVVFILLVAGIASLAPAVLAARVEPVKVLREE
jgi:hypothetical protein